MFEVSDLTHLQHLQHLTGSLWSRVSEASLCHLLTGPQMMFIALRLYI